MGLLGCPAALINMCGNRPREKTCIQSTKKIIKEVFEQNKGRYGYRRVTMELRKRGMPHRIR
ncbi:MAG: IS3 family transposase [Lachnospiraceae bacterium]|nr:IS3 family transposase [Lachnospiraceae bacterium]